MAAVNPLQNLLEEATCPICLGPFKDPVITPCIHNFCRSCITGCFQEPGAPLCCPQCREPCSLADLKPNRQLQSIVELVSQLSAQPQKFPVGSGVCAQHEEKLKLFCQDDKKLICVICQVSSAHEKHRVRPISEAAQDYQVKLQNWLPRLQKERDEIVVSKQKEQEEYKSMRENLQAERMKITAKFECLRQLLKEQEQTILKRLEEMDKKITMVENANIAKLSNEISSFKTLIKEIETKCEQSPEELLKDIGLTLDRCEKVKFREPQLKIEKNKNPSLQVCAAVTLPTTTPSRTAPLGKLSSFTFSNRKGCTFKDLQFGPSFQVCAAVTLPTTTTSRTAPLGQFSSFTFSDRQSCTFKDLQFVNTSRNILKPEDVKRCKVVVTLDSTTAHHSLIISEDGRCVRTSGKQSSIINYPNSFTVSPCVLGKEGFSSGKYYWEVQHLQGELEWTLGVARESVNKHIDTDNHPSASTVYGPLNCRLCLGHSETPNEGIWAVHVAGGQCFALTFPRTALTPHHPPKKVGVYLNCEEGLVSMHNGDTMELLYTFTGASFKGKVHPYFNLCGKVKTNSNCMIGLELQLV